MTMGCTTPPPLLILRSQFPPEIVQFLTSVINRESNSPILTLRRHRIKIIVAVLLRFVLV